MRHLFSLFTVLSLSACDPGGGSTSTDAGPAPVQKSACMERDHFSDETVAGETMSITWPVNSNGPIAPGSGDTASLPNLACHANGAAPGSVPITVYACVGIFGPGTTVIGLEMALWEQGDNSDPSQTTPLFEGLVTACEELEAADPDTTAKVRALCALECDSGDSEVTYGMVVFDGVSSSTDLVARVRTSDINEDGQIDHLDRQRLPYVDTWVYGLNLRPLAARGECPSACGQNEVCYRGNCLPTSTAVLEAFAVTEQSYTSIPIVAGVGSIQGADDLLDGEGYGALAGSINDCDDVAIAGAAVASSSAAPRTRTAYFRGDLPAPNLRATEGDSTYVFLNHPPGDALIGAFVHSNQCDAEHAETCQCVGVTDDELGGTDTSKSTLRLVGGGRVRVFADSVTIFSMRNGTLP
jgi:hypothetical protein